MIKSKLVIAGVTLGALVAFGVVSQPVQAGSCVLVSVKARGLAEPAASKRSQAKLTHAISHWAHKGKLKTVHVGNAPTSCSKGKALFVCTSTAKVCP
jgi:precorrin isomerase